MSKRPPIPDRRHIDVSVLVPTFNEEAKIVDAVEGLRSQRFDGELEFLVIDGRSEDSTRQVLDRLTRDEPRLRILDNPRREIPAALNIGLRAARGEFVARMDAHSIYSSDYISKGVERLRRGDVAWASGPAIAFGVDDGSRKVALALSTTLGIGGARFRRAEREFSADTGFTGILRRATLLAHRGWDEGWPVNEDAELAARVRRAGGRIVCLPEMGARYVPRSTLRSLARQYFRYGQYRAKTCRAHPESMRSSHILPPALALVAVCAVMTRRQGRLGRVARTGLGVYALALLADTVIEARNGAPGDVVAVPLVLATMHLSWGLGFLVGSARFGPPLAAIARRPSPRVARG